MKNEIIVCIPGTWENRTKFIESVVVSTKGDFIFAGMILAHPKSNDQVGLEFCDADKQIAGAFEIGGQGKLTDATLNKVSQHQSVVYLHFPCDIILQKVRILKFTEVLSKCGGIAIKLETSGISHEWEHWFELLNSNNLFDTYCASVVLVGDADFYYSCGMHNFGLPDVQISNSFDALAAADLMNQFSYWRILEKPVLKSGHTFSLTTSSPYFRLELLQDERHSEDDLFHNPNGLWELQQI
jgi:Domain of unknown function (DUF4261)